MYTEMMLFDVKVLLMGVDSGTRQQIHATIGSMIVGTV